jgi:outer membrane receptor protein involved in Fe transport
MIRLHYVVVMAADQSREPPRLAAFVGDRQGEFTAGPPIPPPRQVYPSYTKTDLRAGTRFDSWTATLYVNNVADQRGVIAGGIGSFPPFAFTLIQPRTIGLSVTRTF